MTLSRCLLPVLLAAAATGACQDAPQVAPSGETKITITTVARGLEHPWSLAFLPDGRMLVTERPGRLRYVTREGALSDPIAGLPAVYAEGQGGLLDVVLDPGFANNSTIYFSYAEPAADPPPDAGACARRCNETARTTAITDNALFMGTMIPARGAVS